MALYVECESGGDIEWHVGKVPPCNAGLATGNIFSVQADGDELEHILLRFAGIPTVTGKRVISWFGDDAKFIVANL